MQQVGAKAFAIAQPVDPKQLPVALRSVHRKALIGAGHAWVLHRRLLLRGMAALLVLLAVFGLYQSRDLIGSGAVTVANLVQGEFAAAGFGINQIQISGQRLTRDEEIVDLLTLAAGNSTLNFDVEKARELLGWLRAVDTVTVRKVYPNQIVVDIVEKLPVARWRVGETTYLLDREGTQIGVDAGAYSDLPLVVGDGAADDAQVTLQLLERHAVLLEDLAALSRIGDRRWDLIYYTGLRVQLPEFGVAGALDQLEMYQRDYALLDRDVTHIDLRVPGVVAVRPTVRDEEAAEKDKP
ncbi:MAG TPA: cell division protein FtsQ/DivIB [Devosiaceae bacterium]|nr:cell division protein FtsQ/DivIB [Devosiaceae bacterium]